MERPSTWSLTSERLSCFSEIGEDADIEVVPSLNIGQLPDIYEIGDEISHGNFGITFSGTEISTGDQVVVKEVKKLLLQPVELSALHKEISILTECIHHPGIVKLKCWFEEPTFFYIVILKPQGGKVLDGLCQVENYGESLVRQVIRSLLSTIRYLQEKQISHRGINPESVVLPSKTDISQIALTNFSFASKHNDKDLGLKYYDNSPAFAAPEVLRSRQHDANCDVWSVGVLCFLLLAGVLPYDDRNPKKLLRKVRRGQKTEFPTKYWVDVSAAAMDFTSRCLVVTASDRETAAALLHHQWFEDEEDNLLGDSLERLRFFKARRARNENLRADALWDSHLKNLGYSMTQVLSVVVIQTFARQWLGTQRTSRIRARTSAASMSEASFHPSIMGGDSVGGTDVPPQYIPGDYRCSDGYSFRSTYNSSVVTDTSISKKDTRRRGGAVGSRVSGDVPPDTLRRASDQNSSISRRRGGAVGSRVSGDAPPALLPYLPDSKSTGGMQPSLMTMIEDENEDRKSANYQKSNRHYRPPPLTPSHQTDPKPKTIGFFASCVCAD